MIVYKGSYPTETSRPIDCFVQGLSVAISFSMMFGTKFVKRRSEEGDGSMDR